MSRSGFWIYDGYVKPLPSDVGDFVFGNMNFEQASKVYAVHNSKFGEIWWFYTSAASTENDSYVIYNYMEATWSIGSMVRTAWIDQGIATYPIAAGYDASATKLYYHEYGNDADGQALASFIESNLFDLDAGQELIFLDRIVPDKLLGAYFKYARRRAGWDRNYLIKLLTTAES